MTTAEIDLLRFPVGRFAPPADITPALRSEFLTNVERLPQKMREVVTGLTEQQLDTPYRNGGWTVRQVVHHVPDSHLNAYVRFKLAITQDTPTICAYDEKQWAELPDVRATPIQVSLSLLDAVHARWLHIMRSMDDAQFARSYFHPEHKKHFRLDVALALYSWHSLHHVAHISNLRERMGW